MLFNLPARVTLMFALSTIFALLLQGLRRRVPDQPALAWWAAAQGCWSVAALLLGLRGTAPHVITIDTANALLLLGGGMVWAGARLGAGARPALPGLLGAAGIWASPA